MCVHLKNYYHDHNNDDIQQPQKSSLFTLFKYLFFMVCVRVCVHGVSLDSTPSYSLRWDLTIKLTACQKQPVYLASLLQISLASNFQGLEL